jgi:GNAT superfamily N-acetyltransferase
MPITVSDDHALLDLPLIHDFLAVHSTWAQGIPRAVVDKSIRHSLCFGAYEDGAQVGFARVVTDRATFAYLCDVFVLATHRGQGISRRLIDAVLAHPDLQGLRRFNLATSTAAGLYEQYGWTPLARPGIHMERSDPEIYRQAQT